MVRNLEKISVLIFQEASFPINIKKDVIVCKATEALAELDPPTDGCSQSTVYFLKSVRGNYGTVENWI